MAKPRIYTETVTWVALSTNVRACIGENIVTIHGSGRGQVMVLSRREADILAGALAVDMATMPKAIREAA
jgi:hypothetical protein